MSPRPLFTMNRPANNTNNLPSHAAFSTVGKSTPSPQDVILGRGGHSNHHLGNAVFRSVVARAKPVYHAAPKTQKIVVARSIVEAVYSRGTPPGRFLLKNKNDGLWYEVPFQKAVEKTKQALREKAWKKKDDDDDEEKTAKEEEENEEAEKVGMEILDLPALRARVSTSYGEGLLLKKTSSSSTQPSSAAGKKRKAPTASAASSPSACGCNKPHCSDHSLPLPAACVRQPSYSGLGPGAESATNASATNTAPKTTAASAASSAKSEQAKSSTGTVFSNFFLKMGPIPTTLARLTSELIKGTAEAPPPEKKRKLIQNLEEDGHKKVMDKVFQKPSTSQQSTSQQQEGAGLLSLVAPSGPPPSAPAPAMSLKLSSTMRRHQSPLHQSLPTRLPTNAAARPNAMGHQYASKSVPAYSAAAAQQQLLNNQMQGQQMGGYYNNNLPAEYNAMNNGNGYSQNSHNGLISPMAPSHSSAAAPASFCNPFAYDNEQQLEEASKQTQQKQATPTNDDDWQTAWKSGGTPEPSAAPPPGPTASPLRTETTKFFSSLFFGRDESQSSSDNTIGSGAAGSGGGGLTSLVRKASSTMTSTMMSGMTALSRGLSGSPQQSLSAVGGISRGISMGLGRGLTMAMSFGVPQKQREDNLDMDMDDALPTAGEAGAFDWGDKDASSANNIGGKSDQPQSRAHQQQDAQEPLAMPMPALTQQPAMAAAVPRRMSLIDDDDDEEERPELARLRSLETRPALVAHRSMSAPYQSLHRNMLVGEASEWEAV